MKRTDKTDENLNWLEQKEGHSRKRTQGVYNGEQTGEKKALELRSV